MDKGCFICRTKIESINYMKLFHAASIDDIYIRDCGESTEDFCMDNEVKIKIRILDNNEICL